MSSSDSVISRPVSEAEGSPADVLAETDVAGDGAARFIDQAAVDGFITMADRCRDARNWDGARLAYEEALNLDPGLQPIWIQLGHARKEAGDTMGAEAAYREALALNPSDADGHLQLGHLLKIRGQLATALESYTRALELDPGLGDAQTEIVLLRTRVDMPRNAPRHSTSELGGHHPRAGREASGKTLHIAFDVSDLMHYFRNARLPTGIQRVQIEVIRSAIEGVAEDLDYAIVCFTKETDFWIEIPPTLFYMLCKQAVVGGDHQAREWTGLLLELDAVLSGRRYFRFPQGSVLLNLGTSWWLQNYFLNVRLAKSLYGIRYVPFVHDFIPVMAPEHCVSELRQDFITWAIGAFDHADDFFVNSQATLADLQTVCAKLGYEAPKSAVVTLDADFRKSLSSEGILEEIGDTTDFLAAMGLEKENYVLFVSTIESRKNHIAAFAVWLKLIKKYGIKAVPKLVCVGNPGWLNDATYAKLRASELLSSHVLMLSKISDASLATLYQNSICTLYPSSYEGWGLPVTESLCYGKVPIVSNVSSLPEAGGVFAEYFDVESERDFLDTVERVIFDAQYRARREEKIVAEFRPRTWTAISAQIVDQLRVWAKADPAGTGSAQVQSVRGIWPLEAEMGVLHALTNNTSPILWAGLKSGEIYRNGTGWWWPEPWGCWIKKTGPAVLAFLLKDVMDADIQIYVGIKGVQGKPTLCTLKSEGGRTVETYLGPEQEKVISLKLAAVPQQERVAVISISCDATADFGISTQGQDFRTCGVGVRWVYACRDNDLLARLKMVEALALGDFAALRRRAPESDFFLHS